MARIFRSKIVWSGFPGAPGYTVFHAHSFEADPTQEANDFAAAVGAFAVNIATLLPNNVSVLRHQEVEVLEDTTGTLETVVQVNALAPVQGTGGLNYSAPVGGVISWGSSRVRKGRRMRGRTFVVPMASAAFENNGSLTSTAQAALLDAGNKLRDHATSQLVIYGRPTPLATDGESGTVETVRVPDLAAVLRSRRD